MMKGDHMEANTGIEDRLMTLYRHARDMVEGDSTVLGHDVFHGIIGGLQLRVVYNHSGQLTIGGHEGQLNINEMGNNGRPQITYEGYPAFLDRLCEIFVK